MSDCTVGKELKQSTCRYVKNCKPGFTRNDKFICRKTSRRVESRRVESRRVESRRVESRRVPKPRNSSKYSNELIHETQNDSPQIMFPVMNQSRANEYGANEYGANELIHEPQNDSPQNDSPQNDSPQIMFPVMNQSPLGSVGSLSTNKSLPNRKVQFNVRKQTRTSPPLKKNPKLTRKNASFGSRTIRNSYNLSLPLADEIRKKRRKTIKRLENPNDNFTHAAIQTAYVNGLEAIRDRKQPIINAKIKRARMRTKLAKNAYKGFGIALNGEEDYKSGAHLKWNIDKIETELKKMGGWDSHTNKPLTKPQSRQIEDLKLKWKSQQYNINMLGHDVRKDFMKSFKNDMPVKRLRVPGPSKPKTKKAPNNVRRDHMKSYKGNMPVKRLRVPRTGPGFAFNNFENDYKSGAFYKAKDKEAERLRQLEQYRGAEINRELEGATQD